MIPLCFAVVCAAALGGKLSFEEPAPGRSDGRVYYYVPDGIDLSRPAPLLVFLHGGDASSPDTAPGNYFSEEKKTIRFDIVVSFDAPDRREVYRRVCEDVQKAYPDFTLQAVMDTDFSEA